MEGEVTANDSVNKANAKQFVWPGDTNLITAFLWWFVSRNGCWTPAGATSDQEFEKEDGADHVAACAFHGEESRIHIKKYRLGARNADREPGLVVKNSRFRR